MRYHMRFVKMQGLGNDYVYVDAFTQTLPGDLPGLSRRVSAPHTGIGADGLIVISPSSAADAEMRIFNADGSEAQICGNGLRCVARYLRDQGFTPLNRVSILTGAGLRTADILPDGQVECDMGQVRIIDPAPVTVQGIPLTRVDAGNPHAVLLDAWPADADFYRLGPALENDPFFPQRTNVEFVRVDSASEFTMRVWERGSGETMACGSGACACFAAAMHMGRVGDRCTAHLAGGDLQLRLFGGRVYMTGPAVRVFEGIWPD